MLAPISHGRRDKGTSFRSVCKYVTKERDPITGDEKNRGEVMLSESLLSLNTAHLEMRGVAAHNPLCKDPVYHYQITWHPGEQPSQEQWERAALRTLTDLGYAEHQYLVVAHHDRDHFHAHIVVNKVHPESYRAHSPYRDMYTLDKAIRELEHEQGWIEDIGLYRWDRENDKAVTTTRDERQALSQRGNLPAGRAAELECFRGGQSLQTYAKGQPAADLQMLLARHKVSWADVHKMLYRHGLEMHRAEHGGYTVHAIDSDLYVKASDVFRRAFSGKLNRQTTESKLGGWQEPSLEDRNSTAPIQKYERRQQATTAERQQRREQREEARLALKKRFAEYRSSYRQRQKKHTERVEQRRAELVAALKAAKHEIRTHAIPWPEKRAELSRAVAENVVQCHLLRAEAMQERSALAPLRYENWVIQEAEHGDEAAAAQLRGWRYQDHRLARQTERILTTSRGVVHLTAGNQSDDGNWSEPIPGARLRELEHSEKLAQQLSRIRWTIDRRTGNIRYSVDGKVAVVDQGKAMSVFTVDETAVVFALEVAVRKYGRCIAATGSEEWKKRVAQIAARNDVFVEFTDSMMREAFQEEQLRLGKPGALESYFTRMADLVKVTPDKPVAISERAATAALLDSLWPNGAGKTVLVNLERGLTVGESRRENLKGICELIVSKTPGGQITYCLCCLPDKPSELITVFSKAAMRDARGRRTIPPVHRVRSLVREVGQSLE